MGTLFSTCFKNNTIDEEQPLIITPHCFVCNKTFSDNIQYNRHIPKCKISDTLKKK